MRLFLRKSSGSSLKNGTAGRGWVATYSQLWFFVAGVVSCFVFWNIKMSESKKGEGNMNVFFLGAGKPVSGDRPSALKEINASTCALDWQLHSLESIGPEKNLFSGWLPC